VSFALDDSDWRASASTTYQSSPTVAPSSFNSSVAPTLSFRTQIQIDHIAYLKESSGYPFGLLCDVGPVA
jgi:hypothetical protein